MLKYSYQFRKTALRQDICVVALRVFALLSRRFCVLQVYRALDQIDGFDIGFAEIAHIPFVTAIKISSIVLLQRTFLEFPLLKWQALDQSLSTCFLYLHIVLLNCFLKHSQSYIVLYNIYFIQSRFIDAVCTVFIRCYVINLFSYYQLFYCSCVLHDISEIDHFLNR